MKTSRRGGLGRGLGALIQSTAEPVDEAPQEADATAEDATAPTAAPAEKKAATSSARRSSKETSDAKAPAARAASASKTSGGAAEEAAAELESTKTTNPWGNNDLMDVNADDDDWSGRGSKALA